MHASCRARATRVTALCFLKAYIWTAWATLSSVIPSPQNANTLLSPLVSVAELMRVYVPHLRPMLRDRVDVWSGGGYLARLPDNFATTLRHDERP